MKGVLNLVSSSGSPLHGSHPPPLPPGERFYGNLVLARDSSGDAEAVFALSGRPSGRTSLHGWEFTAGADDSLHLVAMEGYPVTMTLHGSDLEGDVILVGGEVDPGGPGLGVYILAMDTGRILLVGGGGIRFDRNREERITTLPALLDLDGDSRLDILYGDEQSIHAVAPTGANLSGWPRNINEIVPLAWEAMPGGAVTGYVSSEGGLVLAGSRYGLLFAFDPRGIRQPAYPRKVSSDFRGSIDIVSVLEGTITYLDGGNARWRSVPLEWGEGGTGWTTAFGDYARGAFAGASDGWVETAGDWLTLTQDLVVYPNPSTGDRIGFHFTAPDEGLARVEIMTLTGELVLSEQKTLSGGQDEIIVSMSGKASGIYLSRLVVTSGGRSVEAYRKLAIVK